MEIINKRIRSLVLEICIVLALLVASIPIWNTISASTSYANTADYYSANEKVKIKKLQDMDINNMIPTDDATAVSKSPTILMLSNGAKYDVEYNLYLKVNKKNTLDQNELKMKVNNDIYNLSDRYESQNGNYYYYKIDDSKIEKYGVKKYNVLLWMDENATNESQGKTFSYEFMYSEGKVK